MRLLLFLCISVAFSKILMFVALTRHGARAPLKFQPWDNFSKWPNGPGELTSEGMRQSFLLGTYLYDFYRLDIYSLSVSYNYKEIEIHSSKFKRTMQSGKSLANGLYRPIKSILTEEYNLPHRNISELNDAQHLIMPVTEDLIPVHVSTSYDDPLLLSIEHCEEYQEHVERRKFSATMREIYKKHPNIIEAIMKNFNVGSKDAEDMFLDVYDSVYCNHFIESDVPLYFTKSWLHKAEKLYLEIKKHQIYTPDFVARYSGSRFLNNLLQKFVSYIKKTI